MTGELSIDLADIKKTAGIVRVDLDGLELFQSVDREKTGQFGAEEKHPKQNEHARTWLEIDASAPESERERNRKVEFAVRRIFGLGIHLQPFDKPYAVESVLLH